MPSGAKAICSAESFKVGSRGVGGNNSPNPDVIQISIGHRINSPNLDDVLVDEGFAIYGEKSVEPVMSDTD